MTPLTSSTDEASSSPLHNNISIHARAEQSQDVHHPSLEEEGSLEMALVGNNSREDHIIDSAIGVVKPLEALLPPQSEVWHTITFVSVLFFYLYCLFGRYLLLKLRWPPF